MNRTPDEILTDFDDGARGLADIDMRSVMWEIINDVCSSYEIAMTEAGLGNLVFEINNTVGDYLVNHYGDD